jgi:nucleoside-diphosphate kinase
LRHCRDRLLNRKTPPHQPTKREGEMNRTLAIVKPDAVGAGKAGRILAHLEDAGFTVKALKMTRLTRGQAGRFYEVHRERPFFGSLVAFMTSGPCVPMVLEADGAVPRLRETIGATDPAQAAPGTVRALFAENKERNAIHASDSDENAAREIAFFFSDQEVVEVSD